VTLSRTGRLAGVALVGALSLTACGSDSNSTGSGTSAAPATSAASAAATDASPADSAAGSATPAAGGPVTGTLTGEGSSAQKNAINQVITDFQQANPGATVNYNPSGSGAGIKNFNASLDDFAGSDSALKSASTDGSTPEADAAKARCGGNPAWNLPMVAGPIAVAYNLKGADKVILTPEVAAKIFLGQVKTWDDAAIKAINPGVTLPGTAI